MLKTDGGKTYLQFEKLVEVKADTESVFWTLSPFLGKLEADSRFCQQHSTFCRSHWTQGILSLRYN